MQGIVRDDGWKVSSGMMVEVIVKEERDDGRMEERDLSHAQRPRGPADF